jgi:hypothetical protein
VAAEHDDPNAHTFDVDVDADDWRELFKGGKAKKR